MRSMPTLSDEEIGKISGNAPVSLKEAAARWHQLLGLPGVPTFGYVARERIEIKEVSLEPSVDDPQKITTKMVTELDVAQGNLSLKFSISALIFFCFRYVRPVRSTESRVYDKPVRRVKFAFFQQ